MKQILIVLLCLLILAGCTQKKNKMSKSNYTSITAQEAKAIFDGGKDYILLDVRTQGEYREGHIKGALLIPDDEISSRAKTELPNQDALIIVYCRSGRRSSGAAQALVNMGYTNIRDLGGILSWPYEIVK